MDTQAKGLSLCLHSQGNVVKEYDYDAFGREASPDAGDANPFRYCGEYYDKETGFYYLRARYYAPTLGRFISEDSHWTTDNMVYGDEPIELTNHIYQPSLSVILQASNLYVYCINDPITNLDSTGAITFAIGGGFSLGAIFGYNHVNQLIIDDNLNFGIINSDSVGVGTPSVSLTKTYTITTADTIFDLAGEGEYLTIGGSGGALLTGGGELSLLYDSNNEIGALNLTVALSLAPFEAHGYNGGSSEVWGINLVDLLNSILKSFEKPIKDADSKRQGFKNPYKKSWGGATR